MGNGGYGQFITRCLCPSFLLRGRTPHTLPLLQQEVPLTADSSPQISPTRVLPTGCSSSRTAPAWVLPMGCSPSGTGCSSMGPPQGHKPCQQTFSGVGPLSTGPQILAGASPARAPHRVTASFRHPPSPAWGLFHGLQVDICSIVDLHGLQGDSLSHHGLQHELQGKNLCSSVSSTSSPSFLTDLGVCRVVSFTSSHSSLSTAVSLQFFFFPFLNMLSQRRYHGR